MWHRSALVILLTIHVSALCQPQFKVFDLESGLSDNLVTAIVQDKTGYLWVGTPNGLNRFDGYTFKVFKNSLSDSNSLAQNWVNALAVDRHNRIWIGHNAYGLTCYNPADNRFTRYRILDKQVVSVEFLFVDDDDVVLIGTVGHGLMLLDPSDGHITRVSLAPHINKQYNPKDIINYNSVYDAIRRRDTTWLATHDGLYYFLPKQGSVFPLRLQPTIPGRMRNDLFLKILDDGEGGFWFSGYEGGISHFDRRTGKFESYKWNYGGLGNVVNDIKWKSPGILWFAGLNALGTFDTRTKKFSFFSSAEMFDRKVEGQFAVADLFLDSDSTLWASTGFGLLMINHRSRSAHFHRVTNGNVSVSDMFEDTLNARKYFATAYGPGLIVVDEKTSRATSFESYRNPRYENLNLVNDLLPEGRDSLWVVTRDNIRLFDRRKQKWMDVPVLRKAEADTTPSFLKIIKARSGDYWVASFRGGAFRFDRKNSLWQRFKPGNGASTGISSLHIEDVIEDKFGRIWFGSQDGGISIFDPSDNTFKYFNRSDAHSGSGLNTSMINCFARDRHENIWIASPDRGVIRATVVSKDSVIFHHFDNDDLQLPTFEIAVDAADRVWYSGFFGVYVFNPAASQIKKFGAESGLRLTDNKALTRTGNTVAIGGLNGYYSIDESMLQPDTASFPVVINSCRIFGNEVQYYAGESLLLQHDQNSVTIDFAAIDFITPQDVKYSYQMSGVDDSWSRPSPNRSITFAQLPGGDYVFRVRASNREGVWSKPTTFSFTLETPFWARPWFYFAMAGGASMAVFAFVNGRIKKERHTAMMNRKIAEMELAALRAQINPHFLFNSLTSINRFIVKAEAVKASEYLIRFARLIRMILEASREQFISLSKEIVLIDVYLELESHRMSKPFAYSIRVDDDIDKVGTCVPSMVIQPYIENAIWHGLLPRETPGCLNIGVSMKGKYLQIVVEDNGVGRAFDAGKNRMWKKKSYGMQITQDRLRTLNYLMSQHSYVEIIDLHDESGKPSGTKVVLMLEFKKI